MFGVSCKNIYLSALVYLYLIFLVNTSVLLISAKSWGNPSGIPILGLHGWFDNAATMDGIAPLLPLDKYHFVSHFKLL